MDIREHEYSTNTIARKVASVKSFFSYLRLQGDIRTDPAAELDSPKVEKHLPSAISPEDVDRLLSLPKGGTPSGVHDKALIELIYATGLRVSEVVSLDVADVDLSDGTVRCVGKGNKERVLPIYERALSVVDEYTTKARLALMRSNNDEPALFLNRRGDRLTRQGLWLIIKRYVEEAGIQGNVTPHTLRHSFATHMLRRRRSAARCRKCWDMPTSRPRKSTRRCHTTISAKPTTTPIPRLNTSPSYQSVTAQPLVFNHR